MSKVGIKTEIIEAQRVTPKIEIVQTGTERKKDVKTKRRTNLSTQKNSKSATKTGAESSRLMCGFIEERRVRCGKKNCKCARGEKHISFYHVWYADGQRVRRYIRRADVEEMRAACLNYRLLQQQIRANRIYHKQLFARARALFRMGIL